MLNLFADTISGLGDKLPRPDATNINVVFNAIYFIVGSLAVIFIIVGAIRYVLSGGDASKVATAKNAILYAVIGLVVSILAFAITNFILASVKTSDVNALRDSIVHTLFYVTGGVATIMIVVGAFRYVTSAGNPTKIASAKNTILYAVIGLVLAVLAFAIVNFVLKAF